MPLYQHTVLVAPNSQARILADAFKMYCQTIFKNGGVVRAIENHGIRSLPEKTSKEFETEDGKKTFWQAKYITATIDASPKCLREANKNILKQNAVIRTYVDRIQSLQEKIRIHNFGNPLKDIK